MIRGHPVSASGTAAIGGDNGDCALAVHGGAGTIRRDGPSARLADSYRDGLCRALSAGREILAAHGTALDAVTQAVASLEDDPLFNAGRGSVFTGTGTQEMDAAVMDGCDRRAGAVAGVRGPRNPILAARAVMDHSEHVLLIGEGALAFCRQHGIAMADPAYFFSTERWKALQDELELRRRGLALDDDDQRRHGTVGAVARDLYGNLAAATSTGGMTAKAPGRVGDSPIIGAGTFADNATCAVSATGHGEYFIRYGVAFEIAARLRHGSQSLHQAACAVIDELRNIGGRGGVVAVDRAGAVALPFNTAGMYRGYIGPDGSIYTAIWDEPYRRS
ncbi:MAG: isoaspartyl peptidase/L-asparaginase [Alphaproteobacteria bacterium]|nr:isoaspartyl peptidase/L-asparaginase [Alphaproteobacteria bacterium]